MGSFVRNGIMSGYALHIRQLKREDVAQFQIELGECPLEECVAIEGEDLGVCLAAVVHFERSGVCHVVWLEDADDELMNDEWLFAESVGVVLTSLFEHLKS